MTEKLKQSERAKKISAHQPQARLKGSVSNLGSVLDNRKKIQMQNKFQTDRNRYMFGVEGYGSKMSSYSSESQQVQERGRNKEFIENKKLTLDKKQRKQIKKAQKFNEYFSGSKIETQSHFQESSSFLPHLRQSSSSSSEDNSNELLQQTFQKPQAPKRFKTIKRQSKNYSSIFQHGTNQVNLQSTMQRMWKYGIDKICESLAGVNKRTSQLQNLIEATSKNLKDSSLYLYLCASSLMQKQIKQNEKQNQTLQRERQDRNLQMVESQIKSLQKIKTQLELRLKKDEGNPSDKNIKAPQIASDPAMKTMSVCQEEKQQNKIQINRGIQQQVQKIEKNNFQKFEKLLKDVLLEDIINKQKNLSPPQIAQQNKQIPQNHDILQSNQNYAPQSSMKNTSIAYQQTYQTQTNFSKSKTDDHTPQQTNQKKITKGYLISKLQAIKKDQQKNKKPILQQPQNQISKQAKQLMMKHLSKSYSGRTKLILYQFSTTQKYLQIDAKDRTTTNPMSDDRKQKIITLVPQISHEFNRQKVNFFMINIDYWVAVGICQVQSMKKCRFFLRQPTFGAHDIYMMSSGGTTYSNYKQSDHRVNKGFKFNTGDTITVTVDCTNSCIIFGKGKGNEMQKYSIQYDPSIQLSKMRFCVGLGKTKDIVSIKNMRPGEYV